MGLKRIQNGKGERGNLEISLSVNPTGCCASTGWLKAAVTIDPHNITVSVVKV